MPTAATSEYQTLGRALRRLRDRAGLKQSDVATLANIGVAYVSQIENGRRGVRWHTLMQLLAALDADLYQLADAIGEADAHNSNKT